jgi:hypothetical protein
MRTRFVPRIVFATAVAGVTPACHESRPPDVIVLAVQGFAGSANAPAPSSSATGAGGVPSAPSSSAPAPSSSAPMPGPTEQHIIVLAVQGFQGKATP